MKRALILSLLLLFSAVALADNNICVPVKGVEVKIDNIYRNDDKKVIFTISNRNSKQVSVTVYVQYRGEAISDELDVTIDANKETKRTLYYWDPQNGTLHSDYMSIKIKEVTYCSF